MVTSTKQYSIDSHRDGLNELCHIIHLSHFAHPRPPARSTARLLACVPQLRAQLQLSAHSLATTRCPLCVVWPGLPPDSTDRLLACSPIPIHQIPRPWELAPGPRIHQPTRHLQAGPNFQQASAGPRTWGASAPSLLAPFPSHLHLVPLQSSVPSVTRQDPRLARAPATISYLLPVRVWSGRATPMPPFSPL